jgi:hypothetical protein
MAERSLGWLGDIVAQHVYLRGVPLPQRRRWDFVGAQWDIQDDPETGVLSIEFLSSTVDVLTLTAQETGPAQPAAGEGAVLWVGEDDVITIASAITSWELGALVIDEDTIPTIGTTDPLGIASGEAIYLHAASVQLAASSSVYATLTQDAGQLRILCDDGIGLFSAGAGLQGLTLTADASTVTGTALVDLRFVTTNGSFSIDADDDLAIDAGSDIDITAVATCDVRGATTSVYGSDASIVVDSSITSTCTDDFAVTASGAVTLEGASVEITSGTCVLALATTGAITQGQASSGAGRDTDWSTELGQTPGTHKAGNQYWNLGAPVSGVTAQGGWRKADGTKIITVREVAGPTCYLVFGDAEAASFRGGGILATSLTVEMATTFFLSAPTSITLTAPLVECSGQLSSAIHSITLAASMALNWNNGNHQRPSAALDQNVTFTSSNERSGAVYTVEVTQNGSGGFTVTWPANHKFEGTDGDPDLAAGAVTLWQFRADGTNVRCVSKKRYAS